MKEQVLQPAGAFGTHLVLCALDLEAKAEELNRLCKGDESPAFYEAERRYSASYDAFALQLQATTGLQADQLRALLDGKAAQPPLAAWSFRTGAVHLDADAMEEADPRWAPEPTLLAARDRRDVKILAVGIGLIAIVAGAISLWSVLP